VAIVLFKRSTKQYDSYVVTFVQLVAGSVFILPAFALGGTQLHLNLPLGLYLAYNVGLATGFGYVLYFRILAKMPASQFASYFFLVPIFTQLMASVLNLAIPSWNIIIGTALVALGIVAVNR
jgi:drug/metabolite transporter (DMT)-like permease